jgi:hypothetical protein
MTTDQIIRALEWLPEDFDIHVIDDAWYAPRSVYRLMGHVPEGTELPEPVQCVRVGLREGMLELHPKDDKVQIRCYCCFEGNPDQGSYTLDKLKSAVWALRDHYCPPWPG